MKARTIGIVSIVLFLALSINAFSQRNSVQNLVKYDLAKYHFGFTLALNQMNFSVKPVANVGFQTMVPFQEEIIADSVRLFQVNSDPTLGFTIGIVSNLRLGTYFDLRFIPSLSFGERFVNYTFLRYKDQDAPSYVEIKKNITSTLIDFPLHLKYKGKRIHNMRPYVIAGFRYSLDLASNSKKRDDENDIRVKLNKHDMNIEAGVGFDFYTAFFKFGTELKMSYGLTDIMKHEENIYSQGVEYMRSKMFQLSFTFE